MRQSCELTAMAVVGGVTVDGIETLVLLEADTLVPTSFGSCAKVQSLSSSMQVFVSA